MRRTGHGGRIEERFCDVLLGLLPRYFPLYSRSRLTPRAMETAPDNYNYYYYNDDGPDSQWQNYLEAFFIRTFGVRT